METIGQRLKRLRETKGLSQGALAKNAGLKSQGAIGNIESGTRGYGESIVDIARVLSTTPDYLRCMTEDPRTVLLMPANTNSVGGGLTVTNAVTDLAQALEVVAAALNNLPLEERDLAAQRLQTFGRAPDSVKALEALMHALEPEPKNQSLSLEDSLAGRVAEAALSVESRDIHPEKKRS